VGAFRTVADPAARANSGPSFGHGLQRRGHLNGALAAAITARLFELRWIEPGQRRRSVRITVAGTEGLAGTFGFASR